MILSLGAGTSLVCISNNGVVKAATKTDVYRSTLLNWWWEGEGMG